MIDPVSINRVLRGRQGESGALRTARDAPVLLQKERRLRHVGRVSPDVANLKQHRQGPVAHSPRVGSELFGERGTSVTTHDADMAVTCRSRQHSVSRAGQALVRDLYKPVIVASGEHTC